MAKKSVVRAQQRVRRANDAAAKAMKKAAEQTKDSFQNLALNLGLGTSNLLSASTYGFNPITRQKVILEFMHRGNWLAQIAVDTLADDMTRAGIELKGELAPDDSEKIQENATALGVWDSINDAIKWARLYGGSIAFMMIEGQDPTQPLRIDAIPKGSFRGLMVLDRWMVEPSLTDLVQEPGPYLGLPKYYTVVADAPAVPRVKIHYTRCLRLEGCRVPYWQRIGENLWGISVLEPLYDRMVAFDAGTTGASQLIHKSFLRTLRMKGLRQAVTLGGPHLAGVMNQVQLMRQMQQNEGISMLDMEDEMRIDTSSGYAGIADVLVHFGQQISGALQIPLVRLFGQSPLGMNATGASDIRTYYDGIKQKQIKELKVDVTRIYRVMAASLGIMLPAGFSIDFKSLWQMSEDQRAATANTIVSAISTAMNEGIIDKPTALKELRQSSDDTGIFSNIGDEDIARAEQEALNPPPGLEALQPGSPAGVAGGPPGATLPGAPRMPGLPKPHPQAPAKAPGATPLRAGRSAAEPELKEAPDSASPRRHPLDEFLGIEPHPLDKFLESEVGKGAVLPFQQRAARNRRRRTRDAFEESKHPRGQPENAGEFAPKGGGTGGPHQVNPKVTQVGGDEWNKQTAQRLEQEYVAARPGIDKAVDDIRAGKVEIAPGPGQVWDDLSNEQQADAESKWKENNYQSFYDQEVSSWQEGDDYGAMHDAGAQVAANLEDGSETQWLEDTIEELQEQRQEMGKGPIPFTTAELVKAIELEPDGAADFKNKVLQHPTNVDPAQMEFPTVLKLSPSEQLTADMRHQLFHAIQPAFEAEAQRLLDDGKIEPPVCSDSVKESLEQAWDDMTVDEKYLMAKNLGVVDEEEEPVPVEVPDEFDPMDAVHDLPHWEADRTALDNYKKTQGFAKALFQHRALDIMEERGLCVECSQDDLEKADTMLWNAWKASSVSNNGKILQLAIAEELNGRLNTDRLKLDTDKLKSDADTNLYFKKVGGYAGVKAMVRAKWEATQYLLDKADIHTLDLYRAVNIVGGRRESGETVKALGKEYHPLPSVHVARNGALSTTTDREIANDWGGNNGRVVLRIEAPRTAAVSVPAYGINVHGEHEVVLAGTAWKAWDAWDSVAPRFGDVPITQHEAAA
jgi:uncharacterized protein